MGRTVLRVLDAVRRGPWPLSAVTVNLDPSRGAAAELKRAAISRVEDWLALGPRIRQPPPRDPLHDGAVILVSQSLAGWLDDDAFVARLLTASGMSNRQGANLSVLTAAVDRVPSYDRRIDTFSSTEGISVLRGRAARLFPYTLDNVHPSLENSPPSLVFERPPAHMGQLAVHVPLANTLFSNGSQSTLFATQWRANEHQPPTLTEKLSQTSQSVVLPVADLQYKGFDPTTTVRPHLVPITSPILALGTLGNILSTVQIDGQPAPASQHLESIIPRLLKAPRKLRDDNHDGDDPVGDHVAVWALVVPPGRTTMDLPFLDPLPVDNYDPDAERELAQKMARLMDTYLILGCRLHKVLSGGGGWGAKKGLLALDPETRLATDDEDDLDSFKTSFYGGPGGSATPPGFGKTGGLIAAGSTVQFFVEAAYPTTEQWLTPFVRSWDPVESSDTATAVFGAPGAVVGGSPAADPASSFPSLFGAISSGGVYLTRMGERGLPELALKVDSPRSYFVSRCNPTVVERV